MSIGSKTFQSRLIESLKNHSHRIAIEYGDKFITYSQLEARSNLIANLIIGKGIKKGSFIGIYVEDKDRFIAVLIGILKARCVFVPLDRTLPVKRIAKMLDLTETQALIIDTLQARKFLENQVEMEDIKIKIKTLIVLDEPDLANTIPGEFPGLEYQPEDKIYIYFTSGSTSDPKPILGKNKSLLHFINWEAEMFHIDRESRCTQLMNPGFDAFLRDIFVPLFAGGTICIPKKQEIIINAEELRPWMEKTRACLMHLVPGLFRALSMSRLKAGYFPHLKYVLLSGEKIKAHELKNWYDTFGERIQLVNLYGPTETTMIKAYYLIKKADVDKGEIPIGKPMKGAQLILFHKDMKICNRGDVGEIYIRTPYRTFGYYNNEELNRQRFIPNPITGDSTDLLYKTGDLGRELPDGNFQYLGRIDRQLKIRGVRVEPEEIEAVINTHPQVKKTIVIGIEHPDGETRLGAFIVSREKIEKAWLRGYLFNLLPDYMIPSYFFQLDQLPLLPNGKIDEKKMEAIAVQERLRAHYKAPRNPMEEKLVRIFSRILNNAAVGIDDDFFELGGQSIEFLTLAAEIKKNFNIEIPVGQFFRNSRISEISLYILKQEQGLLIKENKEEPCVVFNQNQSRCLFCFPSHMGYGVVYKGLADFLPDYAIYSFNFLEDDDRIAQYADLIRVIQEKGPYRLFGYSAGGNLAFEVARELEKRGGQVSAVIIMDSFSRPVKFRLGTQGQLEEYFDNLGKDIERMGLGFLKEEVIHKSRKYIQYLDDSVTRGAINADLHLITAADRKEREQHIIIEENTNKKMAPDTGWKTYTQRNYFVYPGAGEHHRILDPDFLKKNANIIKGILNEDREGKNGNQCVG